MLPAQVASIELVESHEEILGRLPLDRFSCFFDGAKRLSQRRKKCVGLRRND